MLPPPPSPNWQSTWNSDRRRLKVIYDGLHGNIEIGGKCLAILDTPEFQRLRHIKQLGVSYYLFPSAQHTRFEHSLGTYHIAGQVLHKLRDRQPELGINQWDVETVQMVALCHDIGHGCFSHMLDNIVFPRILRDEGISTPFDWHHEQRSTEILDAMVSENNIDIEPQQLKTVQGLILGDKSLSAYDTVRTGGVDEAFKRKDKKLFLWDIVNNSDHGGIDVDKFDYLARDSRECNIPIAFDLQRVLQIMRVVDDQICFNQTSVETVYDIFHARFRMYQKVYQHKTTKAIELMVSEALVEANHVLRLQDCIHNIPRFCKLDDSILREIYRSQDPSLKKSQDIIRRIETRDLYKLVGEFTVPKDYVAGFRKVTEDDFMREKEESFTVQTEDLVVQNLKFDYGQRDSDPIGCVKFYDDRGQRLVASLVDRARVSNLLPESYIDIVVRLYLKDPTKHKMYQAKEMFLAFQKTRFGVERARTSDGSLPYLREEYHKRKRTNESGEGEKDEEEEWRRSRGRRAEEEQQEEEDEEEVEGEPGFLSQTMQ